MTTPPEDGYHRKIDYLRLSITDRCNLRCVYCMPPEGVPNLQHDDILRYEEILRIVRLAVAIGISKVRVTGGEPLVRKGAVQLIRDIAQTPGISSLSMTTNGLLLGPRGAALYASGLRRINVSLDTLKPEKYQAITGCDGFARVWQGLIEAHRVGLQPIKLNAVVMKGTNDDEIEDLAALTIRYPFHVRFIEFMPFRIDQQRTRFLSSDQVLDRLRAMGPLTPVTSLNSNGPAQHFQLPGALGKIGIISPMSHHFCLTCNRLRITAEGNLRTCLFASEETDLRTPLRSGASDAELIRVIRQAIAHKPEKHALDQVITRKCISRPMSAIGG